MHNANQQQRRPGTLGMSPRRPLAAAKPKLWSHQEDLLALRGRDVQIMFRDNTKAEATLLEADQFAVKIRLHEDQSILIVWKHDMGAIGALPVAAA